MPILLLQATWVRWVANVDEIARCLKQLMWHDITVKVAKCTWGTDEANLIGHEVRCGQGVSASKAKVEDLLAISHLETIGDLKAFLGSCVYLRRFIKDYAMITTPVYALEASQKTKTNKIRHSGNIANWTALHERAFKTLKAALATAPCLAFPDRSRPFIVSSDCSKYQMGGALLQLDKDGKEQIIAFTSKRLNTAHVKWGVMCIKGMCSTYPLHEEVQCVRTWTPYRMSHRSQGTTVSNVRTGVRNRTAEQNESRANGV